MKEIIKKQINKEIKNGYEFVFEISEKGIYGIEIIASAKSWWQNTKKLKSFFMDDDLAVKIDGMEFPKLNGKRGLFDGTVSWNGNNLKGFSKTGLFFMDLSVGSHLVLFLTEQSPFLKNICVYKVEGEYLQYVPVENNPAEDGNRRQWMTIVTADILVKQLAISAATKNYPQNADDDDIRLIIDGETQKNTTSKAHRNWFWCGRVSGGQKSEFKKELNWEAGLHYIDLWADRMPMFNEIRLVVGNIKENINDTKRIPTMDDPIWTGNFYDDTEQMILARVVFGEARGLSERGKVAVGWCVKNRVLDLRWGDNYHDVILQNKQYSAFNETDPNLPYVKNPFADKDQIHSWYKCYEIAGKILNNEVADPTDGANHYFSDYIDYPYWTKDKNAEFKIKIGNTLFYNLKNSAEGGFVAVEKIIIFFVFTIVVSLIGFYVAVKINNRCNPGKQLSGRQEAEMFKYYYLNPKTFEVEVVHFDKDGKFLDVEQLTEKGYYRSNLIRFDENYDDFGYFQDLHKQDESISDWEEYYKNYTALMIKRSEYTEPVEVYRGDVHTSNWEWTDNDHVTVYYGCGTECRYYYKINISTKEVEDEGHVYSGSEES